MKAMKKIFCLAAAAITALCVLTSCTSNSQKPTANVFSDLPLSPEVRARLAALDTVLVMPDDLDAEEQVTFIENQVMISPLTSAELLSLAPIHTLDPWQEWAEALPERQWDAIRMANRFMRMQFVAMGEPEDELQWVAAVRTVLREYADKYHVTEADALDSLLESMDYLAAGTQADINQYCFISASTEYYRTLDTYLRLLEQQKDAALKGLLYDEYAAWNRLNKLRHEAYVEIMRAGEWYSALPMEFEDMYAAYAQERREVLEKEQAVLYRGGTCTRQHPVVRTADWNHYLEHKLHNYDSKYAPLAHDVDSTARAWIAIRQNIARQLPQKQGEAYDNLTADYHWVITNSDEHVPMEYD